MKNEKKALADISNILSSLSSTAPSLKRAKGAGRIFELFILINIASKLKNNGWLVEPLGSDGNPLQSTDPYIQRGGAPSGVHPSTSATQASTIKISRCIGSVAYEILNGIQYKGRSSALHEIDISILPHEIAKNLRSGISESFPIGRPNVSIECKDVTHPGYPDEMRALVARIYDITIINGHRRYMGLPDGYIFGLNPKITTHGQAPKTFLESNKKNLTILCRRGKFSKGSLSMTTLFNIKPYSGIDNGNINTNNLIQDIYNWIDKNL